MVVWTDDCLAGEFLIILYYTQHLRISQRFGLAFSICFRPRPFIGVAILNLAMVVNLILAVRLVRCRSRCAGFSQSSGRLFLPARRRPRPGRRTWCRTSGRPRNLWRRRRSGKRLVRGGHLCVKAWPIARTSRCDTVTRNGFASRVFHLSGYSAPPGRAGHRGQGQELISRQRPVPEPVRRTCSGSGFRSS